MSGVAVVSYRNSTSNHNVWLSKATHKRLYLIEILHQTTTTLVVNGVFSSCILSKFYIKPQLPAMAWDLLKSCILSKFYIKPQRNVSTGLYDEVVSYRNSTSNHNNARRQWRFQQLYLIEILHQTTTSGDGLGSTQKLYLIEILHQTTTVFLALEIPDALYLIEILHQTTTVVDPSVVALCCILSKFYIKPQLRRWRKRYDVGCILSKFYIKPQHQPLASDIPRVVSYRNSTSNHNNNFDNAQYSMVVSYRNSTSNHNLHITRSIFDTLYLIEILHQTTTRLFASSA